MKKTSGVIGFMLLSLLAVNIASAHAVVSPNQVGIGKFQTFSLGIPSEKNSSTVGVRLLIPSGLGYVTPNVKPGWKIEVKKQGTGDRAIASEIVWNGGNIPSGQRDEFVFSAQVPASEAKLAWKVYQTYQDGSVVAWDQEPSAHDEKMTDKGPFSVTKVINDLQAVAPVAKNPYNFLLIISIAALILSVAALAVGLKNKTILN